MLNTKGSLERELRDKIRSLPYRIHQKRRRLTVLQNKLTKLEQKTGKPSLCFGGRKLFRKQFHLEANVYQDHAQWLQDWQAKRNAQSFFLGSSDESFSNQNCQYDPVRQSLKIRLPAALEKNFGSHITIENLVFPYLSDELTHAICNKAMRLNKKGKLVKDVKAVSYRFVKSSEQGKAVYRCLASFEKTPAAIATSKSRGAFGIDLNANHIAVCETDRFGNPIDGGSLPFTTEGKSSEQLEAIFGDHVATICKRAKELGKPIVCERLDFDKKKLALRETGGRKYREMLSSFAYKKFFEMLCSRCQREGVEVKTVNPAYTSIIAYVKFRGYKSYTSHELAALAIARRGLRFSERVKTKNALSGTASIQGLDDAACFFKENRLRHVWSYYSRQKSKIRAHMRASSIENDWVRLIFNPLHPSGLAATRKENPSIPPFDWRMHVSANRE